MKMISQTCQKLANLHLRTSLTVTFNLRKNVNIKHLHNVFRLCDKYGFPKVVNEMKSFSRSYVFFISCMVENSECFDLSEHSNVLEQMYVRTCLLE